MTKAQKNYCDLSKKWNTFSKTPWTPIYRDFNLYLNCKSKLYCRDAASIDLKLHNKGIPSHTISLRYIPKLLKESLAYLVVTSFFPKIEDHNYVFQT